MIMAGVGNLGRALAHYPGYAERGFVVVGLLDANRAAIGTSFAGLGV